MLLRHTMEDDLDYVMQIIEQARKYFKVNQIPQWQNGTPNIETIRTDIMNHESYVLVDEEEIVGCCCLQFRDDPNYVEIGQGRWLNNSAYAVIHRIAIKQNLKGHGFGSNLLEEAEALAKENGFDNVRIDTHRLNLSMQRLIAKNNYTYCGIVMIDDNGIEAERLAYQKEI